MCVCVCVCVMENTSVEYKLENGKKRNLLNSETEKGKIWNGKSVPLLIAFSFNSLYIS